MTDFTRAELDQGRQIFSLPWDFVSAASSTASLPKPHGLEIALAGRSNVGKSSLINALTGRKALARTSNTPGRTQELIFFSAGKNISLVDMPGYGFAAAPKDKVAAWTSLIHDYLRGRRNLARVYVLIDARHGLKSTDDDVLDIAGPPERRATPVPSLSPIAIRRESSTDRAPRRAPGEPRRSRVWALSCAPGLAKLPSRQRRSDARPRSSPQPSPGVPGMR